MNLVEFRTNLRLDLGLDNSSNIVDAELDRAVNRAVNDLSRFLPRERILGIRLPDQTTTAEAFTSAAAHGTAVTLANNPIEHESETVTSSPAGTTYTRDTDYTVDYFNGTIQTVSTGAMGLSTAFLISYERDARALDVSSIDSLEIVRVEVAAPH